MPTSTIKAISSLPEIHSSSLVQIKQVAPPPGLSPLTAYDDTTSFVLPNGVRVVVLPRPGSPNVAFKFYVGSGSQFERDEQHGLSHMMEHSLFKSTLLRSGPQIYAEIESRGGQINAHTHREYLVLSAQVQTSGWQSVANLLAEILSQPAFEPELIEQEKRVVLEEIRRKQDNQNQIWDVLLETIWGEDRFTRVILGTPEKVSQFGAAQVRQYYDERFTGPNTVVVVVGDVVPEQVANVLSQALRSYSALPVASFEPTTVATPPAWEPRTIKIRKNSHMTTILAGWPTVTQYDRTAFTQFKVLNRVLGVGGMGWLRQELREKANLVYNVQSLSATYASRGYLAAMLSVQPANVERAIELLREQIARLQSDTLTEEIVAPNRASYEGSLAIAYEANTKLAEYLGINTLMRIPDNFETSIQQVRAVTAADVQSLAAQYLSTQPYLALLGL